MKAIQKRKDERIMKHSDNVTVIALWWKVIFLIPLWGIFPVAIMGFVLTPFGPEISQLGFLFCLFCGMAYFIEDVLKRKIKIADGVLYFGYKMWQLNNLKSLSVSYEGNKIVPRDMLLTFQDGYILPFDLGRIDADDVQYIVKYIDDHYPHCSIDSTLRTLARCQQIGPQLQTLDGLIELPYHSHRVLTESSSAFMYALASWSRAGPILIWLICSPIWLAVTMACYSFQQVWSATGIYVGQKMVETASSIVLFIGYVLHKGTEAALHAASEPVIGTIAGFIALFLLVVSVKKLAEPNLLILDRNGISFWQGFRWMRYKQSTLLWSEIASAEIDRPEAQPDEWRIVLKDRNGTVKKSLEYAALEASGRADLYQRLKHFAPGCTITADLAERLMPQQNSSYTELWLQSLSSSPNRENLDPLDVGDRLNEGRYEVLMKLGVGGQGAAYLSRENSIIDKNHCQEVVLKETIFPVFVEDSVRRQALERFEHEARTLNLLSHDHIVKLLDYFVEDHRGYLVLEHIEGKNLRDHANGHPMDEKEVIELALQMCEMLEYLHSKNVLHRDFTPDNLMLEPGGTLKLIDFNVAQTQSTGMTGTVVGKHAYVPPEQFRGKPLPASDIYAMGCSLFYLLSGHDPTPISQSKIKDKRSEISTALDTIIRKCTSVKTEGRYQDVASLRTDLERALGTVGTQEDQEEKEKPEATIDISSTQEKAEATIDISNMHKVPAGVEQES